MSLQINGARERPYAPNASIIEAAAASWTFNYFNGYTVVLRGTLFAQLSCHHIPNPPDGAPKAVIRIEALTFDANTHEKLIALDSITGHRTPESPGLPPMHLKGVDDEHKFEEPRYAIERGSMPQEPVNAFGIPQATMRCLELAESVAQMSDLIHFSCEQNLGPRDALGQFAQIIRERGGTSGGAAQNNSIHNPGGYGPPGSGSTFDHGTIASSSLYPGPSHLPPSAQPQQPQDGSVHGTPKQANAVATPQAPGSTPSASASTPAATTPAAASMTPIPAHASLKRKGAPTAGESASPTVAHSEPQAKRPARKRGRTQNGA